MCCTKAGLVSCHSVVTSQSHAEASPRAVETPQALRATGRNDAVKAVSACSREPEVPSVTID